MTSVIRSCRRCVFHSMPAELGEQIHLCTLPPDCAPPTAHQDDDHWHDRDVEGCTYLGTSCDVMRRRDAACGPHASMWLDAHAHPTSVSGGGDV